MDLRKYLRDIEKKIITDKLAELNYVVTAVARDLEITRTALWMKIARLNIEMPEPKYKAIQAEDRDPIFRISGLNNIKHNAALEALRNNNWNRTWAARELGLSLRTMRKYVAHLRSMGVEIPDNPHINK
jgi:DNA-binding NtrC family response regulator